MSLTRRALPPTKKNSLASIGLVVVILAALAWLYVTFRPERIEPRPYTRLGEGAAEATARLLNASGTVVLVDADFGAYVLLAPTTEATIKSFKKVAQKSRLKITALEKVPIAPPSLSRDGIYMQSGQISALITRHADADAIVFFVGLAGAGELTNVSSKNGKPKLILVSNVDAAARKLLKAGVIQMAIAPRPDTGDTSGDNSGSAREWFDRHYQVLTIQRSSP